MSIKHIQTAAFIFILGYLFASISFAQDKDENNKMNVHGHMKMDHSQMQESNTQEFDLNAIDENQDGKVYQCPMDFDVLSDQPGKDPKCGMDLEEVSLKQAADNLVQHGFKLKKESDAITWNKYCPVSGMKVNSKATTVQYDGKTIGFCCPEADHYKTFLKDPEKYMKNLSSDGQNFIGEKN